VTGFQLDLKLPGLPLSILTEAVHQAAAARVTVLEVMAASISEPGVMSEHAPRIETVTINPDRIGELIGPGGKNIKGIQAESGADLNIEDDGTVHIYAAKRESLERAKEMIEQMFAEIEVGKEYTGKIVNTMAFGAFMEVLPGKDGLIHISELANRRVENTEDVVKTGDVVTAQCIGVDEKGRVKMSIKALSKGEGDEDGGSDGDGGGGGGGGRGGDDRRGGGGRRSGGRRSGGRVQRGDNNNPPADEKSYSLTD
jgi:polyribonucleotide nucleotidyltransferase